MTRIGLISDTHSYFDPKFQTLFAQCDEIWHAGDIGDISVLDKMQSLKTTRAVYGNIDNATIRRELKEIERFTVDGVDVMMVHIGGYPKNYSPAIKNHLLKKTPKLFISGHSHILKVMYDKDLNLLHINPGAAGKQGFHAVRTALRFTLDNGEIKDMEVIELSKRP
ncbi:MULTISPECIES: metallophosphoesterase family protein [unclassified Carboxylicivirga]|uniref:metallophosphoesterase family protein n=1 Tax=Carboxylicivirga TaxID=1628153 RepID=UPI003D341C15